MGLMQKRKGGRIEREFVQLLEKNGIKAHKTPLSGAIVGYKGDIIMELDGKRYQVEVKSRASGEGFKKLDEWLGANDYLFLKQDRCDPRVYMTWESFINLVKEKQC